MSAKVDAREIRALLQDRLDELLGKILPGGRRQGSTYVVKNPTRADNKAGSFIVWLNGAAKGGFKDYATEQKGDVVDLCAFAHNKEGDKAFAFDFAKDFLGIKKMDPAELRAAKLKASAAVRQSAAGQAAAMNARRVRAQQMFMEAKVAIDGTPAEIYLASREIPLQLVPHREFDLRFHPRLEYWQAAKWDGNRKVEPGPKLPAMVAGIRNMTGDVTAVHCTFLRADGSGKADVEKPKLMFGAVQGGVVRISRGPDNLTPEDAAINGAAGRLIITEGIEDALSIALAVPEARVWAATSLGNLGNVPVNHACVRAVIVAADNDWNKPQAMEALANAVEQLAAHGVPVSIMRAHEGKDFNDLLKGRET